MYFGRTSGSDWIFFQHERLIHLIVTVTFAVITVLSLFAPAFDGDHDTLWFYHAAPCASCAVYFSLLYT